nr:hypothetical protein StreXyl84_64620 [Streptomyces sp. Xyl84]
MQDGGGDPAQLEPEVPRTTAGTDHEQIGLARGAQEHAAGRPFHEAASYLDLRRDVPQRRSQSFGGLVLATGCWTPDRMRSSGWTR